MIPYMSWWMRLLAWALWKFNGFNDVESAAFEILEHPELLRMTCLLRDYWYVRNARETEE